MIEEEKMKIQKEKEFKRLAEIEDKKDNVMLQINNQGQIVLQKEEEKKKEDKKNQLEEEIGNEYISNPKPGDILMSTVRKVKNLSGLKRRKDHKQEDI